MDGETGELCETLDGIANGIRTEAGRAGRLGTQTGASIFWQQLAKFFDRLAGRVYIHEPMKRTCRWRLMGGRTIFACIVAMAAGCAGPLQETSEQQLHDSLIAAHRKELEALATSKPVTLSRPQSEVDQELSPKRKAELDRISGVGAYGSEKLDTGRDLFGRKNTPKVELTLQQAIHLAVKHNLALQGGRLNPAIAQTQVAQAAAQFDANFFTNVDYQLLDTPRPAGIVTGLAGNQQSKNFSLSTGIRKTLTTGGQVTVQTDLSRNQQEPTFYAVNHYYTSDILLSLTQPVLRGFGSGVNRADIELARSAERSQVQQLRKQLIDTVAQVEQNYWLLVLAKNRLQIYQELVKRTQADRQRLIKRKNFDVTPVQITQTNSYLENNRTQMLRAQESLRVASDQLKKLINDPKLPISGETLIVPTAAPVDTPISFSLLDAVTTALRHRPELQTALLAIKDASIRQRVADNGLLPVLDLSATLRYNGLNENAASGAYDNTLKGHFIDYLLSGQFEMPIGNRGPEAAYHQRRLEREQAVINYQNQAQTVVSDVKDSLHNLASAYEVIGASRAARRAAADNLRALNEQEKAGAALTPEFLLNLKLNAEQQLADAEVNESQSLVNYNNAITTLFKATGTLLTHDGIDFQPAPEQGQESH